MQFHNLRILLVGLILILAVAACGPAAPLTTPTPLPSPTSGSGSLAPTNSPPPASSPTNPPSPTSIPALALPPVGNFPSVQSLDMLDANSGWALSSNQILRTAEGGTSWYNATPAGLSTVAPAVSYFLNDTTAWLLVSGGSPTSGTLYHTTDGGSHWTSSAVPFGGGSMQFLDSNNGWLMAGLGAAMSHMAVAIYRTSDGGATWSQVFTDEPNVPNTSDSLPFVGDKNGRSASDMDHAWVTGAEPVSDFIYVYATQDGGRTWSGQNLSLPTAFSGAMTNANPPQFFSNGEAVLPVGVYANNPALILYVSHDKGQTWAATTPVTLNGRASLPDPQDFFVWDGGSSLFVSHDSGATWTTVTTNVNLTNNLSSFQFVNATSGWAITMDASGNSTLYQTTDGGATWNVLNP